MVPKHVGRRCPRTAPWGYPDETLRQSGSLWIRQFAAPRTGCGPCMITVAQDHRQCTT